MSTAALPTLPSAGPAPRAAGAARPGSEAVDRPAGSSADAFADVVAAMLAGLVAPTPTPAPVADAVVTGTATVTGGAAAPTLAVALGAGLPSEAPAVVPAAGPVAPSMAGLPLGVPGAGAPPVPATGVDGAAALEVAEPVVDDAGPDIVAPVPNPAPAPAAGPAAVAGEAGPGVPGDRPAPPGPVGQAAPTPDPVTAPLPEGAAPEAAASSGAPGAGPGPAEVVEAAPPGLAAPSPLLAPPIERAGLEATPPPATASPQQAVAEQVVSVVEPLRHRADGAYELSLKLEPAELGTVLVDVAVEGGVVHLSLRAASGATDELLRAALPELRAALEEAGLDTGRLDVASGGAGDQAADHAARDPGSTRAATRAGTTGTGDGAPVRPGAPVPDRSSARSSLDLLL